MLSQNSDIHCDMHERNMEVIRLHSEQVEDLYSKYDDVAKLLAELKVCTTSISVKSDNILLSIEGMKTSLSLHEERLDILDDFNWFRITMNKIRDRLPWIVTYTVILIIFIIFFLNLQTVGQIIFKKLTGGN